MSCWLAAASEGISNSQGSCFWWRGRPDSIRCQCILLALRSPLLTVWRLCRSLHWLPRGWKSLPVNIGLSMGKDTRWRCLLPLYRNVSTSLQLHALSYSLPIRCTSRRSRFGSTLLPIRIACELFVSPTVLSARPRVVDKFV